MAFDSGMLSAVVSEINRLAAGARVDKINQPERAEIVLSLRAEAKNLKLCISAASGSPRICFEKEPKENPKVAPSLCMALRKYLSGSKLTGCELVGFERVVLFRFAARDELGYISEKRIYAEIMGKSSGFILCDGNDKIITASRFVDLSANAERKLLPGISYELPPSQGKKNPLEESGEYFFAMLDKAPAEMSAELFVRNTYMGISPLISREIVFRASGSVDTLLCDINHGKLFAQFLYFVRVIKSKEFVPYLVSLGEKSGTDFTFMPITQYGADAVCEEKESFSALVEEYFSAKNKAETARHYAHDLFLVVQNAQAKLSRKLDALAKELDDCKKKEEYKLCGDLITANIFMLKKGDKAARLVNYFDESCPEVNIKLDERLTPAQNAQSYFKKYNKLKNGEIFKAQQIEKAKSELIYMDSVLDSLERAGTDDEYAHIREELIMGGYIKKSAVPSGRKLKSNTPVRYTLPSGRPIFCGKNNVQNDYIDSKLAEKNDWWFHVKNYAGSHVVMVTAGTEPTDEDFTLAAQFAAYNSKQRGQTGVAVDYTLVKNLKKPSGSAPGFVTYSTNYTAYVDAFMPDIHEEK